ncbi:thiamine-monophosphate kinase [Candidatus Omnitrophota bacterium]
MRLKDLGEFSLIERIAKTLQFSSKVIEGIGDDAAVFKYKKDRYFLFTSDMLVEGRHFYRKSGGFLIGKKSLSASVSDIAAMGGIPEFALISLGAPGSLDVGYVDELYRGVRNVARGFKIDLIGGDTVASDKIIINIALLGEVEKKNLVLRSGAKSGDSIFVTGTIGGALRGRHLSFEPRLKETRFLVKNFKINSMIDVSDGLIADLGHILKSSRIGSVIYEKDIPLSRSAKDFESAITDGEDFELVFTVSKSDAQRLIKIWPFKTRLSKIGECSSHKGLYLARKNGKNVSLKPEGYTHF